MNNLYVSRDISPKQAAELFTTELAKFIESKSELQHEVKEYFKHKPISTKNIDEAKVIKNKLEKISKNHAESDTKKSLSCKALRNHNYLVKEQRVKSEAREIRDQEKAYQNNFFKFAKEITNGTFGKKPLEPTFSCDEANKFYKEKYSTAVTVNPSELTWFPKVSQPTIPYDLSPYTATMVKEALTKKHAHSAPGDDGILYEYLKKMPGTHALLAELFTNLRDSSEAPDSWASSRVTLIPKDNEDTEDPTHFRMIALTANVGKFFHTLESSRTMSYMISNKYLDPSAQKRIFRELTGV